MQNRRFLIGSEVTITLPGQGGIYRRNELEAALEEQLTAYLAMLAEKEKVSKAAG